MTVSYRIDRGRGVIETRCHGDVTFAEVMEHFRELGEDASLPGEADVILDLQGMSSVATSQQLRVVADSVSVLRSRVVWGSCAIVADRDVLFGMSRMFEVFAASMFARTQVFRERAAAEAWLALGSEGQQRPSA